MVVTTNLLLALLVAVVMGLSGVIMKRIIASDERAVKKILGRLPAQALMTVILFWLIDLFVPNAFAQGPMEWSAPSMMQIPVFAVVFFVVVGTSNYLFNAVISADDSRIQLSGRFGDRFWFIALLMAGYGVVGAHINPDFNLLPGRQLGILFIAALSIVFSVCCKDVILYGIAKSWKLPGWFRANIGGFAITVVCIALTRTFHLNPGYIYGVPIGLLIASKVFHEREGYFEFIGMLWLIALAAIAWVSGAFLEAYPVLFDVMNLIFVILIEDAFFELLPLPMLAGGAIIQWKKILWAVQCVTVVFFLFHVLFNPQSTVMTIAESPPTGVALMLLGCYAVGVFLLWGYVVWGRRR